MWRFSAGFPRTFSDQKRERECLFQSPAQTLTAKQDFIKGLETDRERDPTGNKTALRFLTRTSSLISIVVFRSIYQPINPENLIAPPILVGSRPPSLSLAECMVTTLTDRLFPEEEEEKPTKEGEGG